MKTTITETQFVGYFSEVLREMDMCSCEEAILEEGLSPNDKNEIKSVVKKEIKAFLDINRSSDLERKIETIIKKKFKNDKDIEKYIEDITRNVMVQLYKNLYTRKDFWAK